MTGYMDQDTAVGRAWEPEDYVDVAHIMERPGGRVRALRCVAAAQVEAF